MLQINCPCCGIRDETEFAYGGEGHIVRPENPASVSDAKWADYLFFRTNTKGIHYESWQHRFGCRLWFNVARDTLSHEILYVYRLNEPQPQFTKRVA